jgi:hypothetical protein
LAHRRLVALCGEAAISGEQISKKDNEEALALLVQVINEFVVWSVIYRYLASIAHARKALIDDIFGWRARCTMKKLQPGIVTFVTLTSAPLASSKATSTSLQMAIPWPETAASMA